MRACGARISACRVLETREPTIAHREESKMKRQGAISITSRVLGAALGIAALCAALLVAGESAVAQQPKAVKIGVIVPLSGAWARQGQLVKMGAETAVTEINAGGGIKALGGAKMEIVALDAGDTPEKAKNADRKSVV